MGLGGSFDTVSRESMLLVNNVLLLVAAAAVLLGTMYPLVIDALGMGKLSVGPPYFDTVFVPLMTPALFLMGVGPLARWKSAGVVDLARRLRWAFGVSVASAVLAFFAVGSWTPLLGLGFLLSAWVASTAVLNLVLRIREHPAKTVRARLAAQPGSYYGMLLAHLGVAVFTFGVTMVGGFQTERDVRMEPGEHASLAGYDVELQHVREVRGPNYMASRATLTVRRDGQLLRTLQPERRVYDVSRQAMTEVAIDRGFTRDLYVALGDPIDAKAWSVRLHHKPFVNWIWIGCLLMAAGGVLAVLDRKYRQARVAQRTPVRTAAVAPAPGAPVVPEGASASVAVVSAGATGAATP